jgi:hypothetical protein
LKRKYVFVYVIPIEADVAFPDFGKSTRFVFGGVFSGGFLFATFHDVVSDEWKDVYHFEDRGLLVA